MNILELKRVCRGFTLRGGEGGGEGGGGGDTGGKPGESIEANTAAGLGPAPAETNENSAYEAARAAEETQAAQEAAYAQEAQNQRAAEVAAERQASFDAAVAAENTASSQAARNAAINAEMARAEASERAQFGDRDESQGSVMDAADRAAGGKPGESAMANTAAGLGSAGPGPGANENAAYESARAAEAAAQAKATEQAIADAQAASQAKAAEEAQAAAYAQEAQNQRAAEAAAQAQAKAQADAQAAAPAAPAAPAAQAKPGEDLMASAAASTPSMSSLDVALAAMAPVDYSLSSTPSTASRKGLGLTASSSGTVGEANLSPASSGLAGMGLGLTASDLGLTGVGKGGFKGQDYSKAGAYSLTNAPAQSYSDLAALDALGMGAMQLNNTYQQAQTVEQALAAKNVHEFLNATLPGLASMMVPAGIPALAWGVISGITSGRISSVADAIGSVATNLIAGKLGIPAGALDAALKGNLGQAAANLAIGELSKALSEATGLPGSVIGALDSATGATKSIATEISDFVNGISGVSDINSAISGVRSDLSNAVNNIGNSITGGGTTSSGSTAGGTNVSGGDNRGDGYGATTGGETTTGGGTTKTPAITTPGAVNTPIPTYDTGISYGTTQSSTPADLAKIGYYYDPFGESIFPLPKTTAAQTPDVLKSLYGTGQSVRAAEGGSIEDLMEYLRS